jgi:hypothetical protein
LAYIVSVSRHGEVEGFGHYLSADILEGEKRLQTANATRWNSQLFMIRHILNIPE